MQQSPAKLELPHGLQRIFIGSETFPSGNPGGMGSEDGGDLAGYDEDYGMRRDAEIIGRSRSRPRDPATSSRPPASSRPAKPNLSG